MIMRLEVLVGSGYAVRVPRSLATKLGVRGRHPIEVQVGQAKVRATCAGGSVQATVALTEPLLGRFSLRRGMRLHVHADNGVLRIGPLVGILVPGTRGGFNPIGNMTLGVAYFLEQGRLAGVYPFAFACKAMDFTRGVVRGYTLSFGEAGYHWVRRTFPLPDVVYDHITYRRRDRATDIQRLRQKLTELQIPFFNAGFFDKWEVHNWLSQNEELLAHLPETRQLSVEALEEMCAKYQRVFIKPAHGSLGRNIAVLTKRDGNAYEFRRGRRSSTRVMVKNLADISAKLPKLTHDFYLVQQGLDLCRAHGRRRDIRAIMQRNEKGHWMMSKTFARIAPSGQLVANITAGATGAPVGRSLRRCFSAGRVVRIRQEMRQVARRVCATMTQVHPTLGELGIDFGVDAHGHVWIIEVNSKPHRKAYDDMEDKPVAKRAFRRPMQYAAYLAGFR